MGVKPDFRAMTTQIGICDVGIQDSAQQGGYKGALASYEVSEVLSD